MERDEEMKTAHEWNDDPRTKIRVVSWHDFGNSAWRQGLHFDKDTPISWATFRQARSGPGAAVTVRNMVPWDEIGPDD